MLVIKCNRIHFQDMVEQRLAGRKLRARNMPFLEHTLFISKLAYTDFLIQSDFLIQFFIPMTDGFAGAECIVDIAEKLEPVRHSHSYGFRALLPLSGKRDVQPVLKTHSSWA